MTTPPAAVGRWRPPTSTGRNCSIGRKAAADLQGVSYGELGDLGQELEATVHFDTNDSRFVIRADPWLLLLPGFVANVIKAFELPRDPAQVHVVVPGPDDRRLLKHVGLTPADGDPAKLISVRYDWEAERLVVERVGHDQPSSPEAAGVELDGSDNDRS